MISNLGQFGSCIHPSSNQSSIKKRLCPCHVNFMTIFQNMVIIRHKMDLFLFIVLKILWMGLGSWALQVIFCIPAAAATCRGVLFPQSQSSPSGFSSPRRSRCPRDSESPIAAASCKAVMCSDVTINNYKAVKSDSITLLIGAIIIHSKMWAFSWGEGETRVPEKNPHDFSTARRWGISHCRKAVPLVCEFN